MCYFSFDSFVVQRKLCMSWWVQQVTWVHDNGMRREVLQGATAAVNCARVWLVIAITSRCCCSIAFEFTIPHDATTLWPHIFGMCGSYCDTVCTVYFSKWFKPLTEGREMIVVAAVCCVLSTAWCCYVGWGAPFVTCDGMMGLGWMIGPNFIDVSVCRRCREGLWLHVEMLGAWLHVERWSYVERRIMC